MARTLVLQGIQSRAGTSVVSATLCRIFRALGIKTASLTVESGLNEAVLRTALSSLERCSKNSDVVVVDCSGPESGAVHPGEESAGMVLSSSLNAPVILVSDMKNDDIPLLSPEMSGTGHVKAFIMNKFTGDPDVLRPRLRAFEEETGSPVIGVIRFYEDIDQCKTLNAKRMQNWVDTIKKSVDICFILRLLDFEEFKEKYCMNI